MTVVSCYEDLLADDVLSRSEARVVARALQAAGDGEIVFWLPPMLAEETIVPAVEESDRIFVAERVPERSTKWAQYVRNGRAGAWIPRDTARVFERAPDASLRPPTPDHVRVEGDE